ncbi:MAG: hypothetical protein MAG453_02133 [Calditrichaeota bacterium]|nr:hypothetical protein [Calditrichota bacterium]
MRRATRASNCVSLRRFGSSFCRETRYSSLNRVSSAADSAVAGCSRFFGAGRSGSGSGSRFGSPRSSLRPLQEGLFFQTTRATCALPVARPCYDGIIASERSRDKCIFRLRPGRGSPGSCRRSRSRVIPTRINVRKRVQDRPCDRHEFTPLRTTRRERSNPTETGTWTYPGVSTCGTASVAKLAVRSRSPAFSAPDALFSLGTQSFFLRFASQPPLA